MERKVNTVNKLVDAQAMSRSILNRGLIEFMSTARLEELANAIFVELRERDIQFELVEE